MTSNPGTPPAVALHGMGLTLGGALTVSFYRTLRVHMKGAWHLPAGLGTFPLTPGLSLLDEAPASGRRRDLAVIPMYRQEAMWLGFMANEPVALQVAVGGRCALTGEPQKQLLSQDPQNYVVLPAQPW